MHSTVRRIALGGAVLAFGGIILLFILDRPLQNRQSFTFSTPQGDVISATYYPGALDSGIIILSGFGADQVLMRSVVYEYVRLGVHVLTFDFPGQGLSSGGLSFDNAATDRLANITQQAMQQFQQRSGIAPQHTLLFGHSLGARVALETSVRGPLRPAGLILFGAQVNLGTNAQSEFFTGTSDSDLTWVRELSPVNPPVPLLLVTGSWEDILTTEGARLLMTALCGVPITNPTSCSASPSRQWHLLPALVHNWEIHSPRALAIATDWSAKIWGLQGVELRVSTSAAFLRIVAWLVAVAGIFTCLGGIYGWVQLAYPMPPPECGFQVRNCKRYLWGKTWLWLAALPISAILMVIYFLLPLHNPTFNLIYAGFIGGYGILLLGLYGIGRMPGAAGKLHLPLPRQRTPLRLWAIAALFNGSLFALLTAFYQTGQGQVPPVGERFAWIFLFTPLTALGFWIGMAENAALARCFPQQPALIRWAALIGLLPFFLRVILLAVLGSISGMLGAVLGLLILAVVMLQGEITRLLTRSLLAAAIMQSVLLYWLVLASGPLFIRPF